MIRESDFYLEKALREKDPRLHEIFKNCVAVMSVALDNYRHWFPTYTDHSMQHALNVIALCNSIIGPGNCDKMNADEVFIMLLGCYFHDIGMGISKSDFSEFAHDFGNGIKVPDINGDEAEIKNFIRSYHHELSGRLIRKYGELFEIPSEKYVYAVAQVARGHRKTDLFDKSEYDPEYEVDGGAKVCLPYLASVIRLADEVDIAEDRNPLESYIIKEDYTKKDIIEFSRHKAIKHLIINEDSFVLHADMPEDKIAGYVNEIADKIRETLEYCREAAAARSGFVISQKKVEVKNIRSENA